MRVAFTPWSAMALMMAATLPFGALAGTPTCSDVSKSANLLVEDAIAGRSDERKLAESFPVFPDCVIGNWGDGRELFCEYKMSIGASVPQSALISEQKGHLSALAAKIASCLPSKTTKHKVANRNAVLVLVISTVGKNKVHWVIQGQPDGPTQFESKLSASVVLQ